jgi:hypothetical protein
MKTQTPIKDFMDLNPEGIIEQALWMYRAHILASFDVKSLKITHADQPKERDEAVSQLRKTLIKSTGSYIRSGQFLIELGKILNGTKSIKILEE